MRIEPVKIYTGTVKNINSAVHKGVSSPIRKSIAPLMSAAAASAIMASRAIQTSEISVADIESKMQKMGFTKNEYDELSIEKLSEKQEHELKEKYGMYSDNVKWNYQFAQLEKSDLEKFKKFIDIDKPTGHRLYKNNFETLTTTYLTLKSNRELDSFMSACKENKDYFKLVAATIEAPKNKESLNSIYLWKGNSHKGIAKEATLKLRGLASENGAETDKYINTLSNYISKHTVPETISLYRKDGMEVLKNVKLANGQTINLAKIMDKVSENPDEFNKFREYILDNKITATQPCFMATSISKDVVKNFKGVEGPDKKDANIVWNFKVKPNTKGVFIEGLNAANNSASEKEVLLQKGSQIQIQDVKYNKYHNIWEFDATVSN